MFLNKNSNCYNIEKNFKYSTTYLLVCSVSILQFSEHFQLIFDNSNVYNAKQKKKNAAHFFCKLFRFTKFFFPILLRDVILKPKVVLTNRISSAFLLHTSKTFSNVKLFSIFLQTFFGTNFRDQNKNNVVEKSSCFVYQLSKKYRVYYLSEHLKYCSQINEYWLNKNACLNILLTKNTLKIYKYFNINIILRSYWSRC